MTKLDQLNQKLGTGRVITQEPLARHTTLGVGGPAEYFFEAKTKQDLLQAIKVAKELALPFFILGGGSNIIVADKGLKGLVIKSLLQDFTLQPFSGSFSPKPVAPRLTQLETREYLSASETETSFKETDPRFLVRAGSGWKMNALITRCFEADLVGLEWFAGIPGTLGGAVYMNVHGGHHFMSEFVYGVEVLDPTNRQTTRLTHDQLGFAYDFSIFHTHPGVILTVDLVLYRGNLAKAKTMQQHWLRQKLTVQPQRSCGSVWQNLEPKVQKRLGLPTPGIGYLIDKKLGLKGKQIGQAQISPRHAGFIVNLGQAKAQDVLKLMGLVEQEAKEELGIILKREVIVVGE